VININFFIFDVSSNDAGDEDDGAALLADKAAVLGEREYVAESFLVLLFLAVEAPEPPPRPGFP
jgi:hypothetical protein